MYSTNHVKRAVTAATRETLHEKTAEVKVKIALGEIVDIVTNVETSQVEADDYERTYKEMTKDLNLLPKSEGENNVSE